MSRIGKQPIPLPSGVTVTVEQDGRTTVKGPKGTLVRNLSPEMNIAVEANQVVVTRPTEQDRHRALHGLTRTLIANMITGVSQGYQKVLNVTGVGFRAQLNGKTLQLNVGYSHPVQIEPRDGVSFKVEQDQSRMPVITVEGIDKEVVGQMAAEVRSVRPPEPYKGKGIRYNNEVIRRKVGKSGKAGAGKGGKKK
ncbi:MAG: 50S ribosomal protein L6 [Armatimonadaceae bacterium]